MPKVVGMATTVESKSHGNRTIVEGMRLVADFEQSGLSQAAYARRHGVSDKSMSYWVRRIRSLQISAQSQLSAPKVRPTPSLAHVADVGSDGAITPVPTSQTTTKAMVTPPASLLPRVGAGVGIEIRCGGRSLVVGPGFDRELLGEVVRFLEGLPPC